MLARSGFASSTPPPDPDGIKDPTLKRILQAMYRRRKPDQ
jgi:hypothetical protein